MRIKSDDATPFKPVTITLETQLELDILVEMSRRNIGIPNTVTNGQAFNRELTFSQVRDWLDDIQSRLKGVGRYNKAKAHG